MQRIKIVDAIITDNTGRMLLQLRDNKSNIIAPASWGLISGSVMAGEKPLNALKREVYEEIGFRVKTYRKVSTISDTFKNITYQHHMYHIPLNLNSISFNTQEGERLMFFSKEELKNIPLVPWFRHLYLPVINRLLNNC